MGKGSAKQEVNEYRMSLHYGICAKADAITGILIGEKEAWSGELTTEGAIEIYRPDLFGGPKKEGGVGGFAYYLPGGPDQVMPAGLAARRGLTSATHPAYRGIASLYFVGSLNNIGTTPSNPIIDLVIGIVGRALYPGNGFMWGATPYMQSIWMRMRRAPKGLDPAYALIAAGSAAISINATTLTVGGTSVPLTLGSLQVVNGHSVTVSNFGRTAVVDGTTITVVDRYTDGTGDHAGKTVTVEASSANLTPSQTTVSLGGVGVTVGGYRDIHSGDDIIRVYDFSTAITAGADANPAHIIYECLTNTSWGMGATDDIVDRASFEAAALTLRNEAFGISVLWTKETQIEAFIGEILDHIQAALYVDPETGKLTLKLFRADYDIDALPEINPDNADLDNFQRKLWGETINEISVTWTNPTNEQEETVTQQALGNIVLQGGTVSSSRNYYGVRNSALAMLLAARDVRQSAAPLASVDAKLDRTQWNLRPGSVVRLSWPEYDIEDLVMRVLNIDYGKIGNPEITVSMMQDIFALDVADTHGAPGTGWIDPSQTPEPLDHVRIITSPLYFTSRKMLAADLAALEYPEVLVNILAASSQSDANFYELNAQSVLPNGDSVAEDNGTRPLLGLTLLTDALVAEAETVIETFPVVIGGQMPTVSGFLFIGDAGDGLQEIALIKSYTDDDGWTLQRGVLDTVPRAWPINTSVWFYDIRNDFFDPDTHSQGETVRYKMQTITSIGRLPIEDTPTAAALLSARPYLPSRPANVTVGGVSFGSVDLSGTSPTVVTVTWATRNRTFENAVVLGWTESSVTPETGQTTTVRLLKTDGTLLHEHTGLTGTSFDIPIASFGSETDADVVALSARDGFESLQGLAIRVRVVASGGGIGGPGNPGDPPVDPGTDWPPPWIPPYCVTVDSLILMADGTWEPAGNLQPGDMVRTRAETATGVSDDWGDYVIEAIAFAEEDVLTAPGCPDATAEHRFWFDDGHAWTRMHQVGSPAGRAMVAKITVSDARTYVTRHPDCSDGVLSHNIKTGTPG